MIDRQHITSLIGRQGEQLAADLLRKKGYQIIATNWRFKHMEVDIIAANKKELVFVEVKTRTSMFGGTPEEAVDENKRRLITIAAKAYVNSTQDQRNPRFDIIGILLTRDGEIEEITHYENAYTPKPRYISSGSFTGKWRWQKH